MIGASRKAEVRGLALDAGLPLADLAEALRAASAESSPESIHCLRAIAAKLEARLRLCGRRALRDDLRGLRRACAELRDLDACPPRGVAPEVVRARRAEQAAKLARELEERELDALCAGLAFVPEADMSMLLERLAAWQGKFVDEGRGAWRDEDASALHALRRRARRIRHAREWLGLDATSFARVHSALGRWHDLQVSGETDQSLLADSLRVAKAAWRAAAKSVLEEGGQA
ncbi:MAG: hypothetical protein RL112_1542 [Planctomycetota bacterium]